MPNTGPKKPRQPIPVLVQEEDTPTKWFYGTMREWRWVDVGETAWEGRVAIEASKYEWIPGERLRRVGVAASPEPLIRP